tara:strand:- start:4516 stop:4860 length:345 start_codon:yes stop_codon:yes gene_type:complete
MSKHFLNRFLGLLHSAKVKDIFRLFYKDDATIYLNSDGLPIHNVSTEIMKNVLETCEILQFRIENFIATETTTAYKILTITKDVENKITLAEHTITNNWNNNKIYKHHHQITTH